MKNLHKIGKDKVTEVKRKEEYPILFLNTNTTYIVTTTTNNPITFRIRNA